MGIDQTKKMLELKLDQIPHGDIFTRKFYYNQDEVYSGHVDILRYMLKNGYLTENVLDFTKTVAKLTETGGGCMYAMLDIHKDFLHECRRLYSNLDSIQSEHANRPYLVRCPYLAELDDWHESRYLETNNDKFKRVLADLKQLYEDEVDAERMIADMENIVTNRNRYWFTEMIYERIMGRDVPNFIYIAFLCFLIKH
jgi:hypothetical protein